MREVRRFLCSVALLFLLLPAVGFAQHTFGVMTYNVENLCDCQHDSLKDDYEFLPQALRRWTPQRFRTKLKHLSRVIATALPSGAPQLVALCEVENDYTLEQLTRYSPLSALHYRYLITHSADKRGIDVALLYQPQAFELIDSEAIEIPPHPAYARPLRDVLHVVGRILTGDTLDVFVCHMPSRLGGERKTRPLRMHCAEVLKANIDSVMCVRQTPYVMVMGDFNDYPNSAAIAQVLQAVAPTEPILPHRLYNLMVGRKGVGTYCYQSKWEIIDHFMVSGTLLKPDASLHTTYEAAHIVQHPFMLQMRNHTMVPFRTYNGMRYIGGYSDHLPVAVTFQISHPEPAPRDGGDGAAHQK